MSRIQVPSQKNTTDTLDSISMLNNTWSAINNFSQQSSDEGWRSVRLLFSDIVTILAKLTESPGFKKIGNVVNLYKVYELQDRLKTNYELFTKSITPTRPEYNQGFVKKSLIIDIFADVNSIASITLDLIELIPAMKFNPINLVLNALSGYATATSNSMNSHPEWNSKQLIHFTEIDNFILDGALLTLKNWDVMIKPIKDAVLDFIDPLLLEPNAISLIGDQNDDKNDVINPDRFFDYSYEIYGLSGNDTLTGGYKKDVIKGGIGNDILTGKEEQDHLFGGTGFDTYHIQDADIVYDEDMGGQLLFSDGTNEIKVVRFQRIDDSSDVWVGLDSDNNKIKGLTAERQGDDLLVKYDDLRVEHIEANAIYYTDSALIKNFFNLAQSTQPTDGNTELEWSGLSLSAEFTIQVQQKKKYSSTRI